MHVAAAADVAVDDVQAGAVVELGVLQTLGRVELAVDWRGVVEDLGERAEHVVVVVEDLVVVAADGPMCRFTKIASGALIMISHTSSSSSSGVERAVAGEVAEGPLGDDVGIGQVERRAGRACSRRSTGRSRRR